MCLLSLGILTFMTGCLQKVVVESGGNVLCQT